MNYKVTRAHLRKPLSGDVHSTVTTAAATIVPDVHGLLIKRDAKWVLTPWDNVKELDVDIADDAPPRPQAQQQGRR